MESSDSPLEQKTGENNDANRTRMKSERQWNANITENGANILCLFVYVADFPMKRLPERLRARSKKFRKKLEASSL
jgi:hypothetical protein